MTRGNTSSLSGGFTLLEVVVALAILSIGLLGVSFMAVTALKSIQTSRNMVSAVTLAQNRLDQFRVDRTLPAEEKDLDAWGRSGKGIFTRTADLNPNTDPDYMVINVTVSWEDRKTHQVALKTIVAENPGLP
ncbi:MAG: prepilin-type N-terminal cleavage/methylation domain-containing protein [Pseudomonadota bacterium]